MEEIKEKELKQIVDICTLLVNGEANFIENCRKIVELRNEFNLQNNSEFLPFVGVTSETDDYPNQSIRANFSKDYIDRIDQEVQDYISEVSPSIIKACNVFIARYKKIIKQEV